MAVDVQKWFDEDFGAGLMRHADEARKVNLKFLVRITGQGGGEWWIDPAAGKVERGDQGGVNLTITMDSSTFAKVYDNPQQGITAGYFAGEVQMAGNTQAGDKFADLLNLAKQ
ncbi:SCP2 sterol-binding domain-containing protein [Streptomyces caniferus]|uniref:SCP2 sterol-binding domain-containing protein n=1 Tax=Streptomyces caniferus TaxID=285557 RepID=UPI002E2E413C|nr:SCP2 sterol-binding domain-containing protein [Streptomyces caniferus]